MAELSEADRRILLGENYKELEAQAEAEGRARGAPEKLWTAQVDKCGNNQFSAFAITVVGLVLFVTNFYAVSGPSLLLVTIFSVVTIIVGVGWYGYLWKTLRQLYAERPAL